MDREDAEDFRQFMAARSAALLRTAYLLTGDRGHAEDLVQNALTKTYRHWGTVRRSGVPEAYVRRILVNERNSRWRRERSRAREVVGDVPDRPGGDEAQAYADRDELWQALQAMPPRTRAVLVLRYWEDLSEAQTADLLGCTVGTVKSQASRGLRKLAEVLSGDGTPTTGGTR
jgi:RNA polymerase sigma-70 factor (sigma-E family)